jgi:hypothetical protein
MNRRMLRCAVITAALMSLVRAQDAQKAIKDAEDAIGMLRLPQKIDLIETMEYWGAQIAPAKLTYHASISYQVPGMRVDVSGKSRLIQVVSGGFAWDESVPGGGLVPGTTATPMPAALKARLLQIWITPFGALKAATLAGSNAMIKTEAGATVITFSFPEPLSDLAAQVTLNPKRQVVRVETHGASPDLSLVAMYSDYKDIAAVRTDLMFPTHIVQRKGATTLLDLIVTKTNTNNPYVVFPVPESVEKAGLSF